MFKIRGHFITQEPYFNNLMSLTFSTECGDLEIMVPNDAYQQYFVADGAEPQMGSYWSLLLFQKNFPDLGGAMMFRFATAEKIADVPGAPVSETPAPTKVVVEAPTAEDAKPTTETSEQPEPKIIEPASDTEEDTVESVSKTHLSDDDFMKDFMDEMKDFMDEAETEPEPEAKAETPAEAPVETEGEEKSADTQDEPVESDTDEAVEESESEENDQAQKRH